MASLSIKVVEVDGMIDESATVQAFASALAAFKVKQENDDTAIAAAVMAQFEAYPGARQNMSALTHGAMNRLPAFPPSEHSVVQARVTAYVQANSDKKDEEPGTRLFNSKRGPGGGCVLNSK